MTAEPGPPSHAVGRDLLAGLVVFLVALPLCLGVALASGAPLVSGLIAGVVGGLVVGLLSGSHTSVSGPAAGLTAVVAAQVHSLGSFPAFLYVLVIAGVIQLLLGVARLGTIAEFIPSSVIKGLLAAIGVILILKQFPYLVGLVGPPGEGHPPLDLGAALGGIHYGAAVIGVASVAVLELWAHWRPLKRAVVPGPLAVVVLGVALAAAFQGLGEGWAVDPKRLVQVPVLESLADASRFLQWPDFSQALNGNAYVAAVTVAVVASLETLLNLEAVDKIDPQKRLSPPSRELVAQGVGNVLTGLLGGLPITSVIVRSSVNINAGGRTRRAAVVHGLLLAACVLLVPQWLNRIPLSCLAAILVVTGVKLASPRLLVRKLRKGHTQFVPFAVTVVAIVATDLLVGVLVGLGTAVFFILQSNLRAPLRRTVESTADGEVVRIELPSQVSFLNRAVLVRVLHEVPRGGRVLLDARGTHYIDPDVVELIRDFREKTDPPYDVEVRLVGFNGRFGLTDHAAAGSDGSAAGGES